MAEVQRWTERLLFSRGLHPSWGERPQEEEGEGKEVPRAFNGKAIHKGIMGPKSMKPKPLEVESEKETPWAEAHLRQRHGGWKAAWCVQRLWVLQHELKGMTENRVGESARPSSWEVLSLSAMYSIYHFISSSRRNHWEIINKEVWSDLHLRPSFWWG